MPPPAARRRLTSSSFLSFQVKENQTVADAFKSYTMTGKKKDAGVVIVSTSAFQVLFERGFIQVKENQTVADAFKSYTMSGKKNNAGVVIVLTSIKAMISS
jgi:predicted oxidoreductase